MPMTVEQAQNAIRMACADAKSELLGELGDCEVDDKVLRAYERRASLKFRIYAKAHGVICDPDVTARLEGGRLLADFDLAHVPIVGATTDRITA